MYHLCIIICTFFPQTIYQIWTDIIKNVIQLVLQFL